MFGKNEVTAPFRNPQGDLVVNEVFYTIQGEGPDAGRPAVFVRLAKCNLRCFFCDTEFEKGELIWIDDLCLRVLSICRTNNCGLVVITGGEPLLQNIVPFVSRMNLAGVTCSVETAGTVMLENLGTVFHPLRSIANNLIVCSPKTGKVNSALEPLVGAWKYIIRDGECEGGWPCFSTQIEGQRQNLFVPRDVVAPIYFQPCDEHDDKKNTANLRATVELCLRHGHRLCIQMHKLAGVP